MAKKRKNQDINDSDIDALFDSMSDAAKDHFGAGNIYTGSEAERLIIGLYLPALCLRYLFQSNILPFERIGQIVGQEGSCKSALLDEFFRITRMNRGRGYLQEAETKDSPIMRLSILNYDEKAVVIRPCEALEDWQEGLTYLINLNKQQMLGTKSKPGLGKIAPVLHGVDSLMGKGCRESLAKIAKDGYSQRSFPAEAMLINSYMKFIPQQLAGWPFMLWGVNHMKPSQDQMGRPQNNIPGGMSLKFQETYQLELHRVKDIKKVDVQGITVKMVMRKNSLGASRLSINADLLWWDDEEAGYVQRTVWDWNTATIDLLLAFEGSRFNRLQEVCDLHVADKSKKLVWSERLNIPRDDSQPYAVAAEALENDMQLVSELHKLLRIHDYQVYKPGVPYDDQLAEAREAASKINWSELASSKPTQTVEVSKNAGEDTSNN